MAGVANDAAATSADGVSVEEVGRLVVATNADMARTDAIAALVTLEIEGNIGIIFRVRVSYDLHMVPFASFGHVTGRRSYVVRRVDWLNLR
ncbi:hypothetical protein [Novosphingobium aquimarinum]|uniref:hypothetical protein n=1 Tax=Novosphingobium aquimarinum TaxID=2682494 RepID=UPI0012EBC74D|nr:hypothetical protein [Novosphingobium aquimarinum]